MGTNFGQSLSGGLNMKSQINFAQVPGSAINTVERIVSAFPQPKKKTPA